MRFLVFRPGSRGDIVVAFPALHLKARTFPEAERRVLTNFPVSAKAAPLEQVLEGTTLVHGYVRYPLGLRNLLGLLTLRWRIRAYRPDLLIYLAEAQGLVCTLRDAAFFYGCGIRRIIGIPYRSAQRDSRRVGEEIFEYESVRLLIRLERLEKIDLESRKTFDLRLSEKEKETSRKYLKSLPAGEALLGVSIGPKVDVADWADGNWRNLLARIRDRLPNWFLVLLGAGLEFDRSQELRAEWDDASVNLRGVLTVRESAAVLNIGLGHGALLYFARKACYINLRGIDGSLEQVAAARQLGIEGVEEGDLPDTLREQADASLDVVVAFEVIEDFTWVHGAKSALRWLLRKGFRSVLRLYIAVETCDVSQQAHLFAELASGGDQVTYSL